MVLLTLLVSDARTRRIVHPLRRRCASSGRISGCRKSAGFPVGRLASRPAHWAAGKPPLQQTRDRHTPWQASESRRCETSSGTRMGAHISPQARALLNAGTERGRTGLFRQCASVAPVLLKRRGGLSPVRHGVVDNFRAAALAFWRSHPKVTHTKLIFDSRPGPRSRLRSSNQGWAFVQADDQTD